MMHITEYESLIKEIVSGKYEEQTVAWYASLGKELADEYLYQLICMDSILSDRYQRLKSQLDGWILDKLSEDEACEYFTILD